MLSQGHPLGVQAVELLSPTGDHAGEVPHSGESINGVVGLRGLDLDFFQSLGVRVSLLLWEVPHLGEFRSGRGRLAD